MSHREEDIVFDANVRKLNAIVEKMTIDKRPPAPASKFEKKIDEINDAVRSYAIVGFFTMIVLAALTYVSDSYPLAIVTAIIGTPVSVLGLAMFVLIILAALPTIIELWKTPYAPFLRLLNGISDWYFPYVQQLAACDKKALEYVLMQYKIQRAGFERRSGMLAGSIEKVGIFPALGALAALATTLSKTLAFAGWVQAILFLILAFNCLNFVMAPMLHRMDEVIAILEYSIASRKE